MDPLKLMARTAGYAVLSLLALVANPRDLATVPFPAVASLLVPFGITVGFFTAYSAIFHPRPREYPMPTEELKFEKSAFVFFAILGLLLAIGCLVHLGGLPESIPIPLVIAYSTYSFATLAYGIFLLWVYPNLSNAPIRYQLIYPILLSITLPLYISLSIAKFVAYWSLLPLLLFAIFFVVSLLWMRTRTRFFTWTLFCVAAALTVTKAIPESREFIYSFLFATAVSAYAAVFESWNVTNRQAYLAKTWDDRASRCYYASFSALVLSAFAAVVLFIFTTSSTVLLVFIAIHSTLSLCVWYIAAPPSRLLIHSSKWWIIKGVFGVAVFIALIVDVYADHWTLDTPLLIESVTVTTFITIFNLLGFLKSSEPPSLTVVEIVKHYTEDKSQLLKHMFILVVLGLGLLCALHLNRGSVLTQEVASRAGNSFFVFLFYCVLTIIALFYTTRAAGAKSTLKVLLHRVLAIGVTLRIFCSVSVGASVVVPALLRGEDTVSAILSGLPFSFASMGGFALNDYLDIEKDRRNRPYRPLPSGVVSPSAVLFVGLVLILLSTVLALRVANGGAELTLYLATAVGVVAYNGVVRISAWAKTVYTGLISCLPFCFIIRRFDYASEFWAFPVAVLLFITGRELWMDVHDLAGDRACGLKTFPVVFGEKLTSNLGSVCLVSGCLLLLTLGISGGTPIHLALALVSTASSVALVLTWPRRRPGWTRGLIYACWVPMASGMCMLVLR